MRIILSLQAVILAVTAVATANPPDNFALLDVDKLGPNFEDDYRMTLKKRACDYNGCECDSRGKQLTVCGNCRWGKDGPYAVTRKRVENHIFECSPTGNCCDYGYATDCGTPKARCIVNNP